MSTDTTNPSSVATAPGTEIPDDLVRRLMEIIEWRKSGVAELPALNAYVDANLSYLTGEGRLQIAEDKTLMEAARLLVAIALKEV
jgi:hypothetical protein